MIRVKDEKIVFNLDDFSKKKCRNIIEELENLLNEYFFSVPFSTESFTKLGEGAKPTKKFKRYISIFATTTKKTQKLATTLPLPPALFRRLSNFSFYKVADSIF